MRTINEQNILKLLESRDESALTAITEEYGSRCRQRAARILGSEAEAEEVFNDALMLLWNNIPPEKPRSLGAYLNTIVTRLSLNRLEKRNALKRGDKQQDLSLDEFGDSVPDTVDIEQVITGSMLNEAVNRFLQALPYETRTIFVARYTLGYTVPEIAKKFRISQGKTAMSLMRTRKKLRTYLQKEGWL